MVKTCDKKYTSLWINVIQTSLEKREYEDDQYENCVLKAEHFKTIVEIGGEERFSGNQSWCQNPCVLYYLLGMFN